MAGRVIVDEVQEDERTEPKIDVAGGRAEDAGKAVGGTVVVGETVTANRAQA